MATEVELAHLLTVNGFQTPTQILAARTAAKLGLPVACAMLELESGGGRNEFGHDPTNFIGGFDHITGKHWGPVVTELSYEAYKAQRVAHGNQGVGPCQLTSPGLQDEADAAGGCWIPVHNMAVGFHYLHDLIEEHGLLQGCIAYNGSGPAAQIYGEHLIGLAQHYKQIGLGTVVGILNAPPGLDLSNGVYILAAVIASIVAVVGATATGVTVFWRTRLNAPSEWRQNYLAERQKSADLEEDLIVQRELKHSALTENAQLRAATDLTGLMRIMSENNASMLHLIERLDDKLEAQTEVLTGLVLAVQAMQTNLKGRP